MMCPHALISEMSLKQPSPPIQSPGPHTSRKQPIPEEGKFNGAINTSAKGCWGAGLSA